MGARAKSPSLNKSTGIHMGIRGKFNLNTVLSPSESLEDTEYASGNLLWDVNFHWLLGIEGIWGKREDKDGASASDFRSLFIPRFSF